ncbi:MAG: hypothetical protein WA860_13415, partial [Acidimicrobiales bacterium]
ALATCANGTDDNGSSMPTFFITVVTASCPLALATTCDVVSRRRRRWSVNGQSAVAAARISCH